MYKDKCLLNSGEIFILLSGSKNCNSACWEDELIKNKLEAAFSVYSFWKSQCVPGTVGQSATIITGSQAKRNYRYKLNGKWIVLYWQCQQLRLCFTKHHCYVSSIYLAPRLASVKLQQVVLNGLHPKTPLIAFGPNPIVGEHQCRPLCQAF